MRSGVVESLRWTYKCGTWRPNSTEWIHAAQCVQAEEKTRIGRFVFKRDARSAMAGRLLMRKAVSDCLGISYNKVKLGRTDKGKPFLQDNLRANDFSFNVSHQGDYAVLAAERSYDVGVDIMKTEMPRGGRPLSEYFHTMRRQLTPLEWDTIHSHTTDRDKLEAFYRFWCLKESYVKALGVGIGYRLDRLSFQVHTPKLNQDTVTTDTQLLVDGELVKDWLFEESLIDSDHTVAVALSPLSTKQMLPERNSADHHFEILSFRALTLSAQPLSDPDKQYWTMFDQKEEQPPGFR